MEVIREVIIPTEENHTIELPRAFYGKEVEVIFNVRNTVKSLPKAKKIDLKSLFNQFGEGKDFPTTDEIRNRSWAQKW